MANLIRKIGEEIIAMSIVWVPMLGIVVVNTIIKLIGA